MFSRIFPKVFDNQYRGHWLGLVLFIAVILVKALQGLESLVFTHSTMTVADGIPVDTFGVVAANNAVDMFALLGMYLLVLPLTGAVALVRYRAMIPFLYLMLIATQLGARGILFAHAMMRPASAGGHAMGFYVNLIILAVTLGGFALSLLDRPRAPKRSPREIAA